MRVSLAATFSLEHLSEECGPCILPRLDSELKPDSSPSRESQISSCKVADTVEAVRVQLRAISHSDYHLGISRLAKTSHRAAALKLQANKREVRPFFELSATV